MKIDFRHTVCNLPPSRLNVSGIFINQRAGEVISVLVKLMGWWDAKIKFGDSM